MTPILWLGCTQPENTILPTMSEEMKRYSDAELEEFKSLIESKLKIAEEELQEVKHRLATHGRLSDDTLPTYKALEEGSLGQTKDELNTLALRQQKFIQGLQAALIRIENKTYGVCRATGNLIPKERLRAVPHATLSIEAKQMRDKR